MVMKLKNNLFLFYVLIFGLSLGLAARAGAATNISNSPGTFSTCSRIAVDSRGVVHVAWVEMYSDYTGDCLYARSEDAGRTWTTPRNLSQSSKVYASGERTCDIDVDGLGRVYAVWIESNVIKLAQFVDGAWQNPIAVATARASMNTPKIAAGPQGDLYIAWWTEDGTVFSRSKVGGAWEDVRAVSAPGLRSKFTDIALGNQFVYLTWMEGTSGGYRAVYAWRAAAAGSSWSSPGALPSTGYEEQHPIVVADANDIPNVVWSPELTAGGVRYIAYTRGTGGGFTAPERISSETVLHYPSLAIRGQTLFACWQTGSYRAGFSINFNIRTGGAWKGEESLPGSRGSTFSDISASPTGDIVYVVWDAANDIYFARAVESQENLPPVADFALSPASGDFPLTVAFDGSASYDPDGKIADYGWAFGDGTTGKGKTIRHAFTGKGTFTVRLTVRDNRGAKGTATRSVEVTKPNVPPDGRFTFVPKTGVMPLDVTFDASASRDADGRIAAYDWTFGDEGTGSGKVVKHTYRKAGTFKIGLIVTDDRGGRGQASGTITILKPNVTPVAEFKFSPSTGICPLDVGFDASASHDPDGRIVSYLWDFGDGAADSGRVVRHTYAIKGTYTLRLTVKDDRDGQAAKEAALIALNLQPPLNVRWETYADRALFYTRYITDVRWDGNPENDSIATIVGYKIYRKKSQDAATAYRLIDEVGASVRTYRDYDVGGTGLYAYTVTAVDSQGHESPIE
jgi:PKD repeat protein